jgi:sugar/nucleoside kinase (ribokinase family)
MHEFVALGDIVADTFIKIPEGEARITDGDAPTITLPFADKIPYESAETIYAVGNSANAAVAAAKLGLSSALASDLGDDELGKECLAALTASKVDTSLIKVHPGSATNHHYALWYGVDRTILVKHEKYEYKLPEFAAPKWLYLSSLGNNTESYHIEIASYIMSHPEVSLAFQPGTFQINMGADKLKDIYAHTTIFFCNIQEAEKILGINTLGIQELLKRMQKLGPKIVIITDGPRGAYAYTGEKMFFVPVYPDGLTPYERTGAGDAFASTCVAALALGLDLQVGLAWGAVNSASVVQKVGAQKGLLTRAEIQGKLSSAPDFKVKPL